jgi:hypothetical protein
MKWNNTLKIIMVNARFVNVLKMEYPWPLTTTTNLVNFVAFYVQIVITVWAILKMTQTYLTKPKYIF